jgi:hypothetical protein
MKNIAGGNLPNFPIAILVEQVAIFLYTVPTQKMCEVVKECWISVSSTVRNTN